MASSNRLSPSDIAHKLAPTYPLLFYLRFFLSSPTPLQVLFFLFLWKSGRALAVSCAERCQEILSIFFFEIQENGRVPADACGGK